MLSIIERQNCDEDSEHEKLLIANLISKLRKKMSAQNKPERGFCIKNKPERGFSLFFKSYVSYVSYVWGKKLTSSEKNLRSLCCAPNTRTFSTQTIYISEQPLRFRYT